MPLYDLLTEDFQRLESLYPYNEEVDTLIKLDEVQGNHLP